VNAGVVEVLTAAMKLPRRRFLHLAAGAAALPALSRVARAQAYPTKPVRLIVPFAAGGSPDIFARLIGQWLSERLGQSFLIENRPGGGGNIGTEGVVRAPADGYTLLLVADYNAINATLYDKLNFNFHERHCVSCRHHPRSPRHGGKSVVPRQNGSRVHCIWKGQSRQNQHGVRWCRFE
jgi:hypothetical protein